MFADVGSVIRGAKYTIEISHAFIHAASNLAEK